MRCQGCRDGVCLAPVRTLSAQLRVRSAYRRAVGDASPDANRPPFAATYSAESTVTTAERMIDQGPPNGLSGFTASWTDCHGVAAVGALGLPTVICFCPGCIPVVAR